MTDRTPLLHLTTTAEWRAALDTGTVRPPSLAEVGFVHLSGPAQVHLPAQRLFAGRTDVVVLVVDPDRLTDPVRLEPGVPTDPAGMRFPHLYGALPVAAVVAVVPWQPDVPLDLPAPEDAAGRARALAVSLRVRSAAEVRHLPGAVAVLDPACRHSGEDDRLIVTGPTAAADVAALATAVADDAGWPVAAVTLLHPGAGPVADALAAAGWDVSPALVMTHRGPFPVLDPGADLGDGPEVAAALRLRVDGATAAVDAVPTDSHARRRGAADALLAAALHRAGAAGCDLVVLAAAALDGQRHWYERRGFTVVGRTWDAVRRR